MFYFKAAKKMSVDEVSESTTRNLTPLDSSKNTDLAERLEQSRESVYETVKKWLEKKKKKKNGEKIKKRHFVSEKKKVLRSWDQKSKRSSEQQTKKTNKTLRRLRKEIKEDKGKKFGYKRKVAIPVLPKTQRLRYMRWVKRRMRKELRPVLERTVLPAIMIPIAELLLKL